MFIVLTKSPEIMPYKEKRTEKLYYTIGEVAEMFQVNTSLIRFWEKEFTILQPKKNSKGNRKFNKKDIEHLQLIYQLVKEKGMTLRGAKDRLKKRGSDQADPLEVIRILTGVKEQLLGIRNNLDG